MKNRLQIKYHIPESLPTREEAMAYLDNFFTYSGTSLPAEPLVLLYNNNPLDVSNGITEDIRLKTSNVLLAIGRGGDGKNIENNQKYFLIDFAKHEESLISLNEKITNLDSLIKETILEKISQLNTEFQAADAEINDTVTTLGNNLTIVDGKVTANEQAIAALQAADETIRGEFEAADAELSDRIDAINTSIAGGVHFIGVFESLDDIENVINGDIAIVENKEYIYSKSEDEEIGSWIELGDTTSETERISALEKSVEEITTVSLPNLETAIQTEKSERETADAEILKTIEDNELVTSQALNELSEAIQTEKSEREAADADLNNTISSINQDIETIKNNAVYTITVDNADTNKITVEKTNNTYAFNFDAMVIDGGEY